MSKKVCFVAALAAASALHFGHGTANAQPFTVRGGEVNITGATLFRTFFTAPASTNDWIDADKDGIFGYTPPFTIDQLAPDFTSGNPLDTWWLVQYRGVGSGNGIAELVNYDLCGTVPLTSPSEWGLLNRSQWYPPVGGVSPYPPTSVDIAVTDVPLAWFVLANDATGARWNAKPCDAGYGWNTVNSKGDTCLGGGFSNLLQSLCRTCPDFKCVDRSKIVDTPVCWVPISYISNRGVALPDRDPADGKPGGDIKQSELAHLFVTGRMPSGENLVAGTRDVGSGTRNGAMNSIGVDPSFGQGENVGRMLMSSDYTKLGPFHQMDNCGGSSRLREVVQNNRLAIGYNGTMGSGGGADDAFTGKCEQLNVMKDIDADGNGSPDGSKFVRPTITSLLDNADPNTGWQIGGPETFVTVGNPLFAGWKADLNDDNSVDGADYGLFGGCFNGTGNPIAAGCENADLNGDNSVDGADYGLFAGAFNGTGNRPNGLPDKPTMKNKAAADYVRNIVESVKAFTPPIPAAQFNMPGEYLATYFVPMAALDATPELCNPAHFVDQTGTTNFNAALQGYVRTNLVVAEPAYGSVTPAGKCPTRLDLATPKKPDPSCPTPPGFYEDDSDGAGPLLSTANMTQYRYYDAALTVKTLAGGANLSAINAVQGDFDGNGARNGADIAQMMVAAVNPLNFKKGVNHGGAAGAMVGDYVIAHVIGDFNGDGNMNSKDVRYFADGLALYGAAKKLNRKQGFTDVDTFWGGGNYFATTLATGKVYVAGDSRGDVAGSVQGAFPGAQPNGFDGVVNGADIDYVQANVVKALAQGAGDMSKTSDAVGIDLSCDMNGDLFVNKADVTEIVTVVLGTCIGDLDLNGHVTAADLAIANANLGANKTYTQGDVDIDGDVDAADIGIITAALVTCP